MPTSSTTRYVRGVGWEEFRREFAERWKPGEHIANIGPTGEGKTTFAAQILGSRKYVLALDPKGGDSTLTELESRGFERVSVWPLPRSVRRRIEQGEPARMIIGSRIRSRADRPKLRELLARTIDGAFEDGGWTLYIDELQQAADRRLMNLGPMIEENLIAGRDRRVSVVTSYQRPANVPRAASEMATWLAVWYTRDAEVVDRLAQMTGRPKPELRGAISELEEYCVLLVNRRPREPMIVTRPPRL
jgi:hypothetical protein